MGRRRPRSGSASPGAKPAYGVSVPAPSVSSVPGRPASSPIESPPELREPIDGASPPTTRSGMSPLGAAPAALTPRVLSSAIRSSVPATLSTSSRVSRPSGSWESDVPVSRFPMSAELSPASGLSSWSGGGGVWRSVIDVGGPDGAVRALVAQADDVLAGEGVAGVHRRLLLRRAAGRPLVVLAHAGQHRLARERVVGDGLLARLRCRLVVVRAAVGNRVAHPDLLRVGSSRYAGVSARAIPSARG